MTHPRSARVGREIENPRRELTRLIQDLAPRWNRHEVFGDFVELSSLAISNVVDPAQFTVREARYLDNRPCCPGSPTGRSRPCGAPEAGALPRTAPRRRAVAS